MSEEPERIGDIFDRLLRADPVWSEQFMTALLRAGQEAEAWAKTQPDYMVAIKQAADEWHARMSYGIDLALWWRRASVRARSRYLLSAGIDDLAIAEGSTFGSIPPDVTQRLVLERPPLPESFT